MRADRVSRFYIVSFMGNRARRSLPLFLKSRYPSPRWARSFWEERAIDRYFEKAKGYMKSLMCEEAITTSISGIERGSAKCAFALAYTTLMIGTDGVMSEDEALDIFKHFYKKLKLMAHLGDAEAMYMIAQSIRLNFVEDDDDPYGEWLEGAADLGCEDARLLLKELDELDIPEEPEKRYDKHGIEIKECHATTMTLDLTSDASVCAFSEALSRDGAESIIRVEPDHQMILDYGIDEILAEDERRREIDNTEGNREDKWGGV